MGLIVKNLKAIKARLSRSETKVMDGSLRALRAMGELVAREARLNAPVDTGELEEAITTIEERTRNSRGQFGQVTIRVGVDVSKLKLEDHKGYDYSIPMHEGTYDLGPLSLEKQTTQTNEVGRKYLERALRDNEKKVRDAVQRAVERGAVE